MGLRWHGFSGGSMEQVVLVNCALAAKARRMGRGLAPTAFKMSPLPGLNSHKLFDESSLLHSGCDTCSTNQRRLMT